MKPLLTENLRMRIIPALLPVFAIVIIGGLFLFVKSQISQIRKVRYAELSAIGELKSSQITNWLNERFSDADYFSTSEEVKSPLRILIDGVSSIKPRNNLDTVFHRMKSNHQYEDIYVANLQGNIIYSFNHRSADLDSHMIKGLRIALKYNKIELNDFSWDSTRSLIRFGLIAPIEIGGREDLALIFTINPEKFLYPLIANWPIHSRTSESLLIRMEEDSIVILNPLRFRLNAALRLKVSLKDLDLNPEANMEDSESNLEASDYRGERVMARIHAIQYTPWKLISKVDKSEVYADLRNRMILISVLVVLLFFTLYIWMAYIGDRRMRLAIEESNRLLEETSAIAHIGGWTLDPVTSKGTWTAEVARIHELDPLLSPNMEMGLAFYVNKSRQMIENAVTDLLEQGIPYDMILEIRTAKGKNRWVRTTGMPQVKNGKVVRISGIMHDVTVEKQAEEEVKQLTSSLERRVEERTEQLNKSIRELEAFTYSVSHDLRTPLRAIDGFSAILEMEHGTYLDEEARRIIRVIRQNAQKMGILIDELLTFSRLGRAEITRRTISMKEMAESVFMEIVTPEEKEKCVFKLGDLHPANADGLMIRQVWMNLISNALKFSRNREHPEINVSSVREGDKLIYHISDNGSGFDMKYYSKLFGVFQRLHTEKEFEGTGVGLAIVQQVVTRHGGQVWAEGKVNGGAVFSFSLPMVEND